jgi:hypothetical protein
MTKMYDSGKIIAGIIIFLVLITSPIWYNLGSAGAPPKLEVGTKEKQCVESTDFMKSSHMQLLDMWRDEVVRKGNRIYKSKLTGKPVEMSLENTCMKCHTSKAKFCDRCHNYVEAAPQCWDCHNAPKEDQPQKQALRSGN